MKKVIQYDISRGRIPRPETVFSHVQILKKYGLTGVLFYIECVVENSVFPASGCGKTPVTKEYLSEIRSYLDWQGMEFIPIIQVLGHQKHLLERPEMEYHRECKDNNSSFRIDSAATREAIKSWLSELIPSFSSGYVHVGGDEAFSVGLGRSREYVLRHGFEEAIAGYFNEIHGFLISHGKKMVIYADLLIHYPAIRDLLDRDIVICNWGYCTMTEIYEQENHNFSMHEYVTSGRVNWVTGNNMAEYVITPFQRLEENTSIWLELGNKSNANCFIISDWGSYSNINPFTLSLIGDIYILERLRKNDFSLENLLDELSILIIGNNHNAFKTALRIMFEAQKNPLYFGERLKDWSPLFPTLWLAEPDSRDVIRTCACFEMNGLIKFEQDARKVCKLMNTICPAGCANHEILEDIKALARRLLALALRTRLCFDHTWYTGAVWLEKSDFEPLQNRLDEYIELARQDLEWYMGKWNLDNLEGFQKKCRRDLTEAITSVSKAVHRPENSMLLYPPKK